MSRTSIDWHRHIMRMMQVKRMIDDRAPVRRWEFHLPGSAATEARIAQAELMLGLKIEQEYRSFLRVADGWRSILRGIDLFGTEALSSGDLRRRANESLDACGEVFFQRLGMTRRELVPIAATPTGRDVFVMIGREGRLHCPVIWLAEEDVDRFETFEEYFVAMISQNDHELHDLLLGAAAPRMGSNVRH